MGCLIFLNMSDFAVDPFHFFNLDFTPPRPSEISKHEKLEGKCEASFDVPFIIQKLC